MRVVTTIYDYKFEQGLIEHGAKTLIVPGIPPLGCSPPNLELFRSDDPTSYEPRTRCLKEFNELAVHHNSLLQEALENVQTNYPNALVIYADFFTPIIKMVESPWKFGQ
jgi:phospholipase/lecithinase/hemolysin